MTAKTLETAIGKATTLPEAAQAQIGQELLERIQALEELRAAIEVGARQLDAGEGQRLDIEAEIRLARTEHDKG